MDGERMELENPLLYLKRRARKALESQGVVLPPPPIRRPPSWRQPELEKLPPGVVNVRHRMESIGLDIICNNCERDIPKSKIFNILCHFYSPDGPEGSPLTRCLISCPYCYDYLELGRNIGDADNFGVITGATQHYPPADPVDPGAHLNEAYPDALLDSPNDFDPRPRKARCVLLYSSTWTDADEEALRQRSSSQ